MLEPSQASSKSSDSKNNHIRCPVSSINKNSGDLSPKKLDSFDQNLQGLSNKREISSIPKANGKEGEYWIYPSERMFFQAMRRKNWNPRINEMQFIVPIHNAVNEQVWREILSWEKGWGSEMCGGPKLVEFEGKSSKMSPKARWLKYLGYKPPFDRHDWKIDRCGKEVTYIIDFYSGKKEGDLLSFYLDVRPKLSINGAWMRLIRVFEDFFQKKKDL
ncbi:hypothetical protein PNEG_01565 [Pneumocystis murina B123]|uniref:Holocytochrome c-type synthase n=1 Tax=Pneumocystis murina (strain B123) TaxID=1069680 RepID=M7NTA7_PNEMU|nr:hypothetical protein PNEG_01565 [Pneumocystis murina B123]EMR10306.1 hypothetical protein PNEG_01565 [Pneumocystis murina B123]